MGQIFSAFDGGGGTGPADDAGDSLSLFWSCWCLAHAFLDVNKRKVVLRVWTHAQIFPSAVEKIKAFQAPPTGPYEIPKPQKQEQASTSA